MSDLDSRAKIHDLVVAFYREIVFDDLLAPVFEEVAEVDWSIHIPKLIDYWCRVLLGEPGYDGSILAAHRHVHDLEALRVEHFDRWYALWERSVDVAWEGPRAEQDKSHAGRIGGSLARQLLAADWRPLTLTAGIPAASTSVSSAPTTRAAPTAECASAPTECRIPVGRGRLARGGGTSKP